MEEVLCTTYVNTDTQLKDFCLSIVSRVQGPNNPIVKSQINPGPHDE